MKKNIINTRFFFNIITSFIFIILFLYCHFVDSQEVSKRIQINGKLKNIEKSVYIYLYEIDLQGFIPLDSVNLNKSGHFSFNIDASETRFLFLRTAKNDIIKLIASPDDRIFIEGNYNNLTSTYNIKGSYDSEILKQIDKRVFDDNNKVKQLSIFYAKSAGSNNIEKIKDSLDLVFNTIKDDLTHFLEKIINENSNSLACLNAINQSFGKIQLFSLERNDSLYSKLTNDLIKQYPNNKHAVAFNEHVKSYLNLKSEQNAIESRVGVYKNAPEIRLNDKDSNIVLLSDFRGKIVLLKFWNPNCDICREENLKLIPFYKKYKNSGFEIFELSIGTKKEEWLYVINEDKTDMWVNVKIPEEGDNIPNMGSYYVWLYGVKSVPYLFLINKEGVIINKGFKIDDLEEILSDVFE